MEKAPFKKDPEFNPEHKIAKRKAQDRVWISLPALVLIASVAVSCYGMFLFNQIESDLKNIIKTYIKLATLSLFGCAAVAQIYFFLLIQLRAQLKSLLIYSAVFAVVSQILFILILGLPFHYSASVLAFALVLLVGFFLFKKTINIALMTGQTFLDLVEEAKIYHALNVFKVYFSAATLILLVAGGFFSAICFELERADKGNSSDKTYKALSPTFNIAVTSLFFLFMIIYAHQLAAATAYIYGAAVYDQHSVDEYNRLSKAGNGAKNPEPGSSGSLYLEKAHNIAFNKSFGSACLGAFLVAIIRFLQVLAKNQQNSNGNKNNLIIMLIARVLLEVFGDLVEALTNFGFLYCAMYGKSMVKSGKMAVVTLKKAGLDSLLNMCFIENLLVLISFAAFIFMEVVLNSYIYLVYLKNVTDVKRAIEDNKFLFMVIHFCGFFIILFMSIINNFVGGGSNVQIAICVEDPDRLDACYRAKSKLLGYMKDFET